jgi:GxxExxY protein
MLEIGSEHTDKLLHRGITEAIIGAAFEVHGELECGFLERAYQRALQIEPSRRGFPAEIERCIQVKYKGIIVGDYDADLIVAGSVVVEIKVNPPYDKRDEAQLLNELKATGLKIGLLVNVGRTKVEYERLIF